jgi:hypothetical protein
MRTILYYIIASPTLLCKGFVKRSSHSVLLVFSQSYVQHDLRKNKIVVPFFC